MDYQQYAWIFYFAFALIVSSIFSMIKKEDAGETIQRLALTVGVSLMACLLFEYMT